MDDLPESTQLLYSQLLSQCLYAATPNGKGLSFVKKNIKNSIHHYLQFTVGSKKTQHYIGPDNEVTQDLIKSEKTLWQQSSSDRSSREQLVSMMLSGGALSINNAESRVFESIERAGVFLCNGVLVGSHAFSVYGNMLGVNWSSKLTQTHDIDIGSQINPSNTISIGLQQKNVDLKQVLIEANMGFIAVPALNRKAPSTSFKIQGKQLSVDLLTPMLGKPDSTPLQIKSLNTYAEPVRFLNYLLEDTQPAIIIAKAGILVNVPTPARFALHKLVVAERRPVSMQIKANKDIDQATQLIEYLLEHRPGDIQQAIGASLQMPEKFQQQLESGISRLPDNLSKQLSNIKR